MNLIKLFQLGRRYMKICPTDKHLAPTFPEIKIISAIKYAIKYLPVFLILLFLWQFYQRAGMVSAVITGIFAISLPIHGVLWLGKRANTPLPLNLLPWYLHTKQKLIELGVLAAKPDKKDEMNLMHFMQLYDLSSRYLSDDDNQIT
ncbi:hypothetical protein DES39_0850 [Orbus hercynius]|uniref:UPF0208 membrane protein YfbV n=1 Tax=Orbus hercynius TaxID=593135 RepID=A0A495RJY5_9GAMM|nr:terminus macrodomain insulation protein YfbV [Orbus hercynius]RKS87610.1 hypothetical protein DES39_0850 [Orbus hercynius]